MPLSSSTVPSRDCDLDIWRYTMRHLLQQRSPVETAINECVERFGRANDAVQFLGTLLRGGDFRLDFGPFTLHPVKMALALQNPIASPEIVQDQQGGQANGSINAELKRDRVVAAAAREFLRGEGLIAGA